MWHDGGMTGSMTARLSCHSQADILLDRQSHFFIMGGGAASFYFIMGDMPQLPVKLSVSLPVA